ncbi:aldehyde dehydrogenase [Parafrankia colletiae]|uniref:aldehyde dehydrogenase (NAD(+)) n=1 Tax=Parafrankia colletiae TaxID=573497 RepID=A0A1S1Q1N9_9ACTN|nr:aldehyde dehydrogenase family protein [Parafrankia colletiae]MCK9903919.1 aldehyde dehydrogenase family protein [Frankia sp. Cpl3]OHV28818.1 aldehyde dehydrogenase [Parafrankia colletiae]
MIEKNAIFIDGQWVSSAGTGTLTVINPATEEPIATLPRGHADDVDRAAQAAARAFETWSQTTVDDRIDMITRIADILDSRAEELARTITSEVGTPITLARRSQAGSAINDLRIAAASLKDVVWEERFDDTIVRRIPAGVAGAITPWNGPMRMIALKAGAAFAAGCTMVLKGTEVAPLSSFIFAEAAVEAGLPKGVFNLVSGTGPEVGEALATHPLIDIVSLTGSVRAGSRVMELASRSVKRVALELGGKSANIILEDADLEKAVVDGLSDAFRNSGQVCGGLTRMLVPRGRLAEAEAIAAAKATSYVIGDPTDEATTLGPVVSDVQRDRVRGYIQVGIDEGLRLVAGGPEAPAHLDRGYFVQPTVFVGDNRSRLAQEEIFGPVVIIIPFDDTDEAVAIANDSDYGLAGAVWSADPARARDIGRRIRTGRVRINGAAIDMRAPHGGLKRSGVGREMGRYGIEEYLEYQSLIS